MDKKNKVKIRQGTTFSLEERHAMIKEYLSGHETKTEVWRRHTGQKYEKGQLMGWMRPWGYISPHAHERGKTRAKRVAFHTLKTCFKPSASSKNKTKEALEQENKLLSAQLKAAKIESEGYQRMLEMAEKTYPIPIKKSQIRHDPYLKSKPSAHGSKSSISVT